MSALHYRSGQKVMVGDRVRLAADEGRVLCLDEELKDWGLSEEDRKGKVMIECQTMALVCEYADSEDLIFISRSLDETTSGRNSKTGPNQSPQRNAGSRPFSGDSPASETPSSLGPRG